MSGGQEESKRGRGRPRLDRGKRPIRSIALYDEEFELVQKFVFILRNKDILQELEDKSKETVLKLLNL